MAVEKVNFSKKKKIDKKKKDWAMESRTEEGSSKGSFQLRISGFSIPHPPPRKTEIKKI